MVTAGIIVIGNEVLSGKVEEENARYMIRELRALGVDLERVSIIRDEVDVIAKDVRELSPAFDLLFTSGGVGATHDDVTMQGVARGLGLRIVRHPALEAIVRARYRGRAPATALRMADVPEGTVLVGEEELLFPIVSVRNVYVLPGVPEFLRAKFEYLRPRFANTPVILRQIFVRVGEDEIAEILREVDAQVEQVEIGSYPRFDTEEYRVKITFEGRDIAQVERSLRMVLERLDPSWIVRVE